MLRIVRHVSFYYKPSTVGYITQRCVIDLPYYIAEDVHHCPITNTLLTDLSWKNIIEITPIKNIGVFSKVKDESKKFLTISGTKRLIAMLPVTSVGANHSNNFTIWVPFIVATGSRQTYFNKATVKALNADIAENILVDGVKIWYHNSVDHFEDINLLGTDVLESGVLNIDYPNKNALFTVTNAGPSAVLSGFWVNLNGGTTFKVYPKNKYVDSLKDAVKEEEPRLDWLDADELVVTKKNDQILSYEEAVKQALDPESKLEAGTEYAVYCTKE
mmetsp:Transcript_1465/g.2081  ORF Transcript_1465/g.2081 Transcript_1465/m.2081 type:complete len:273 (-) Transcript_1465:29-847(-)